MEFVKKIWSAIKGIVQGRYEAAFQRWGERSWLPASYQAARLDADTSTRVELVRRSRYWERNNAIVNRLVDLFEQFTVGANGLQVIPSSENDGWNQSASEWWAEWCKYPDLISLQGFGTLQSLMARSWFVDGEIFIHKTYSPDTNRPRIRLIEAQAIRTPKDKGDFEGKFPGIVDGVEVNAFGRPVGYWFEDGNDPSKPAPVRIPASEIVHIFEPARTGQYRGLPFLYPVMNDLHDMDDLQMQETKKAKAVANTALLVTNAQGEADAATLRRQRFLISSQNKDGTTVQKQPDTYYDVTLGASVKYLKTGEDVKTLLSDNPSAATQWFWDYLTSKVCAGVGISKLLVIPYSMQGTVTRADLDVSTAFFRARSAVMATAIREIYAWVMKWAIQFDRAMDGAPPDWFKVTVRPPRAPNVDVGRNSTAMLAELEAATRTYEGIYAENGEDWRQQLRQKAKEAAYIKSLAVEFKVEPGDIAAQKIPPPQKSEGDGESIPIKEAA